MTSSQRGSRWPRALAGTVTAAAVGDVVAAGALSAAAGWSWRDALSAFVVTNGLIGVAFAASGGIIAWHRPRNPIGWLFLAGGIAQATTAMAAPLVPVLQNAGAPTVLVRTAITLFGWSWPWSIGLCLPAALLLFPEGHLPSRRWRPVLVAIIVTAPLFTLEMAAAPEPYDAGLQLSYLTLPFYDTLGPLWTFAEVRTAAAIAIALLALMVRYRHGTDVARRQLLWLVLAVLIALAVTVPWGFVAGTPIAVLFAIPLIPIAVMLAIVRHQLLDIRLVVSRAVAWLMLSLGVIVAYAALVALLDRFLTAQVGRSAIATVILALIAAPLLPPLQRLVDRAMYGDRRNPTQIVSRVGEQLTTADSGLVGAIGAVRTALRLPYVAIEREGVIVAGSGAAPSDLHTQLLTYDGRPIGTLIFGLRKGEAALGVADRRVLDLLTAPLAVAVHSTVASQELQTSRERLVAAREEERRRLRRQLHDGLGPALTGIAFSADAAANLIESDRERSIELLTSLRRDTRDALADVRRLVDDLRPPALDELGLVGALRQRADQLAWRADGAAVDVQLLVPPKVPALPAAVEVATYRIATEALTNVVRHSRATSARVELQVGEHLEVSVVDDGPPDGAWVPGVGLHAMRERTAELGGSFEAGPSPTGGRVRASFPLAVA